MTEHVGVRHREKTNSRTGERSGSYQRGLSSGHQCLPRTTNGLKRLFGEVKRRMRITNLFPGEKSGANLYTAVVLKATKECAF
jgi:transposase-like protein